MKEKIQKVYDLIQESSAEVALHAPKHWLNAPPAPSFCVTDLEAFTSTLEAIYVTDKNIAKKFSRKTVFQHIESKIFSIRRNNIPIDDNVAKYIFDDLLGITPQAVTVVAPISGVFLATRDEFQLGCFKFFNSKKIMISPGCGNECLCISTRIANSYDKEVAIQKAESCFSDFCRMVHFIAGTFDKKNVIKIGLPLLPQMGLHTFAKTDSFSLIDDEGNMLAASISNKTFNAFPIDDDFFCNHVNLKNVWELYDKMHNGIKITKLQQRLINAVLAIGESSSSYDLRNSVIYSCVALETLLSFDEGSLFRPGIGEQIAEALAFIVAKDLESRESAYKFTKKIYAFRSALVHGGNKIISNEYIILNHYIRMAIADFFNNEKWKDTSSIEDVYDHIKKLKFS